MAVKRMVWAKFINAGQTCIAPDYILVDKSIEKQFLELLKLEIKKEKFSIENGNYTQIINIKNFERLSNMIPPEKVYFGGGTDTLQRTIQPTILQGVEYNDEVMKEEIFGPILPVISYDKLQDAISYVNNNPKPLSCYLFSNSKRIKKNILRKISFGGGAINEAIMHISNPKLPFGGVGDSGIGSYHGEAGFKSFTHYKSILDKSNLFELSLKYYPHSNRKLSWIRLFMKL